MELNIYDEEITPLGVVDEIESLIWKHTYWQPGESTDVKLLAPATANNLKLLKRGNIIIKHDNPPEYTDDTGNWYRAAQIKRRHITKSSDGAEQIEVQCCLLKKWLDKRVIINKIVMTGTSQDKINRIVNDNIGSSAAYGRQFPQFVILSQEDYGGEITEYANEDFAGVKEEIHSKAVTGKLGYDILVNEATCKFGFYLFKGKNRIAGNNEGNGTCTFAEEYDNVNEQEYEESDQDKKNVIYASGEANESGVIPVVVLGDEKEGLSREEVYVDLSSIKRTYKENEVEITIADEEYEKILAIASSNELDKYKELITFNASINSHGNLIFRTHYNVGDRITVVSNRWGIKTDVRITAINEIYQKGIKNIDAVLGDSTPTIIEQIRKVRR